MKKIIALTLVLVTVLALTVNLASCRKDGSVRWMEDLTEYVADIGDATALGISSSTDEHAVAYHSTPSSGEISLLSVSPMPLKQGKDNKNYIVKTTTTFSANTPEADATGLTKVTFTKIETGETEDGKERVLSQEEVGGEIDKLYVLGNYTFISYVPEGESQRPADTELVFDTDGIASYDKCDYFSSSDRQSFVIDNATGYIYHIEDFNVKEIQGGCLVSADDNFIYDFKINANNELEIFSLFTNDTIEWYSCFKDKYGNKFIQNNRLNTYDTTTNTYFYVFEPFVNAEELQYCGNVVYELTSTGEAIALIYPIPQYGNGNDVRIIEDAYIVQQSGQKRSLTREDTFEIYYDWDKINRLSYDKRYDINAANTIPEQDWTGSRSRNRAAYKVVNGVVYGYSHFNGYSDGGVLMQYDAVNQKATYISVLSTGKGFINVSNLEEHDIVIEHRNGTLYYYTNVWAAFEQVAKTYDGDYYDSYGKNFFSDYEGFTAISVLGNCSIDGVKDAVMAYGVNGNIYYDIVAEEVNGEVVIKQYVKGTYQKPQVKIILQPLNK